MRCTRTGTTIAPSPRKKRGARNDISSAHSHELFPAGQVAEERPIQRLSGVDQRIVDALLGELGGERVDVLLHQRAVLISKRLWDHWNLLAALQVLERRG